jgi:hypothetical protein
MERITGHILDTSTGQRSEYTEYKDFKHVNISIVLFVMVFYADLCQ